MKKAFLQLHIAVFLAGFTAILGRLIQLNEGLLVWYRLLFSIVILGIGLMYKKQLQKITWLQFRQITGVGFILAFHWLTFYASVKYANASVAVVCLSAAGFYTALLEPVLFRRKIRVTEFMLGLVSVAGIYIIFDFHPQYQTGIIFGMISSLGSALFPIYNKRLLRKIKPASLTFYEFTGGFVMLSFLLPAYFYFFTPTYYAPTQVDLIWLMALVLFCTILAFALQLSALTRITAFTSNLTYNLEPVYGILLAFIFLGEGGMVNWQFYIGLLLIVFSIACQMLLVFRKAGK